MSNPLRVLARIVTDVTNSLSIGGRVTPHKAVLESLPTYYFSLFKVSDTVIDGLEAIIRRFLWGGSADNRKINWVSWDQVVSLLKDGGLGIGRLEDSNMALLSKWIWRYRNETGALWRQVIDSLHGGGRGWTSVPINSTLSGVWKAIVNSVNKFKVAGSRLNDLFRGECGKGDRIRFWLDPWVSNLCLKDSFPMLCRMEKEKKCLLRDRFCEETRRFVGCSEWYSNLSTNEVLEEWIVFSQLMENDRLNDASDKWSWREDNHEAFSVKSVKKFIRRGRDYSGRYVFKWEKGVSKKCNIFMWRASLDRLPTYKALHVRNCNFGTTMCGLCETWEETIEHLLSYCHLANEVWDRVFAWCKVGPLVFSNVKEIIETSDNVGLDNKAKKVFKAVVFVNCWSLWKARNDKIFEGSTINGVNVFSEVKTIGYLWYKSRFKRDVISWED